MKFYMDVFWGINFIMDLLLLWMAGGILHEPKRRRGLLFGAMVSASLACAAVMITRGRSTGAGKVIWLFAALGGQMLSSGIAFGFKAGCKALLKRSGLLCVLGFLSAGVFLWLYTYTGFGMWIVSGLSGEWKHAGVLFGAGIFSAGIGVFAAGAAITLMSVRRILKAGFGGFAESLGIACTRGKPEENRLPEVEVFFLGEVFRTRGFLDTGNGLTDPVFHRPVILADGAWAVKWIDAAKECAPERYVVIPYHSVGTMHGLLEGVVADYLVVHTRQGEKRTERIICAAAKGAVSNAGEYGVILPPQVF